MQKYKNRSEVPDKYKWDLTDFFENEEDFEVSYENAKEKVLELNDYKGCTKDSNQLYEFLKKQVLTIDDVENLYVYAYLINDQELGITSSIERKSKTTDLYNLLSKNISFFEPELLKLSKKDYDNLFIEEPKLQEFKLDLDRIYRRKSHVLNEKEENIISELTNSLDNFDDLSSNMINQEHDYGKIKLEDGSVEKIANNNYRFLMKNNNRDIRKKVYNSFNKTLNQYGTTSAGLLNSYVKGNNSIAKIHNFKNAWDSKLFNLNFSDKVFEALINTVEKNVSSLKKYMHLKKKILGYDKLYYYDSKVNLITLEKEYSIEEAQELIKNSLQPLGTEYMKKFNKIFTNRYIDYCQYKGKCGGGYSFSTLSHDSRILMSYNGNLESVSTIAHEGGHNVHHQFLLENNPLQYRGQSTFVSEVASLTNECLLSNYIAKNAKTKEEKLAGISNMIEVIISNLFGAVREGKVEQEMYKLVDNGGTITKEFMDDLVKKSYKKYYGTSISLDKNIKNSWIIRSHYYMNFYLFSYAISISVATNVAQKILEDDKDSLDKYLKFLSTGCDKWTQETFEILGINLEDENVYINAIKYFDELVKEFENIYYDKEVGEA